MRILGRGSGSNDEPRLGTYMSLTIALVVVLLGDLDAVAPVLSMFFLATYAVVNFVSAGETYLGNPSFRPTFRIHWSVSLLGAIGCVAVMLLINPVATVIAVVFVGVIWTLLNRRRARSRWGDMRQGIWINIVRWAVSHIRRSTDTKSWRPNILVLAGSPTKRWYLIELSNALTRSRGMLTIATILPEPTTTQRKRQLADTVREHLAERDVSALVRVVSAPTPYVGASVLVEAYGLGTLMPNTVVLGDGETTSDAREYATMVSRIHDAGRNVVIVRASDDTSFGERRNIDVWLSSIRDNGALMIVLADALRSSKLWRRSSVTVRMVVPRADAADDVADNLRELFASARLRLEVDVIVDERPVGEVTLDLALVVDLRQQSQFSRSPGFVDAARTAHLPLVDQVVDHEDPPPLDTPTDIADLYVGMLGESREQVGRVLDRIADTLPDGPVLVHCAFGKDRAGLITALIHAAIGVRTRRHRGRLRAFRRAGAAAPRHPDREPEPG